MKKKFSKQKLAIYNSVKSVTCHPTADEIYTWLKPEHPSLSLGTVYRNLNTLVEEGEVLRLPVPGSSDRYDGTTTPHEHAICKECNTMYDLDLPEMSSYYKAVEAQIGMTVETHTYLIRGVCAHCQQGADQEEEELA